jgi:hypothetical protein
VYEIGDMNPNAIKNNGKGARRRPSVAPEWQICGHDMLFLIWCHTMKNIIERFLKPLLLLRAALLGVNGH